MRIALRNLKLANLLKALRLLFWVSMLAGPLTAQSVLGTWQATLPVQPDPRVVLTLRQATGGSLAGSLTFIDHDNVAAPLPSVTLASSELRFAVADITYSGKFSADGKSLAGTWTRGTQRYPLIFTLATPETAWTYAGPARLSPMSASADPTFEVVTIKPSQAEGVVATTETRYRVFKAKNSSVLDLVKFAYHVTPRQVQGGPSWMNDLRFDVVGQPDLDGLPSVDQHRLMVKKLLAERFHLVIHDIQPVFPVYALTLTSPHAKVTPIAPNDIGETKILVTDKQDGTMDLQFVYTTIPQLDDTLMSFIKDRQIVDETGLTAQFNTILTVPSEVLQNSLIDDGERRSAFFKAVQTAGFRLTPKQEPLRVIVVDRVEHPTQN